MKFKQKLRTGFKELLQKTNRKLRTLSSSHSNNMNSGDNNVKRHRSFFKIAMNIFIRFVIITVRMVMKYIYGEKGAQMPPIKDLILLESATSLAHKIRTKKVSLKKINSYVGNPQNDKQESQEPQP
jgi:hypothetical protein